MKLMIDKHGMLTYHYEVSEGVAFSFHTLREVGAPYQGRFSLLLARRGVTVEPGYVLPFPPYVADFKRVDTPDEYRNNAHHVAGVFGYTSDFKFWYVYNYATNRVYCVGRIGGSRGHGRGINYRDRAVERATRMHEQMLLFYNQAALAA